MSFTIITQAGRKCPYCHEAAALLDHYGLPYSIKPLKGLELKAATQTAGMTTVPIIYHFDTLVGGYEDLKTYFYGGADEPA